MSVWVVNASPLILLGKINQLPLLSEAWAKRKYPAHFVSKLTDADGELAETRHWIATARACGYLSDEGSGLLASQADRVGGLLGGMIQKYRQFCVPGIDT